MSTEKLARFLVETQYKQIPAEAVDIAKKCLLDYLGVALAGSKENASKIVVEYVRETGGAQEAGIIGAGFRTVAAQAALANGTMGHALDYDDYGTTWVGHPSVVLAPSVLAVGEKSKASGKDVLEAYILGWEVGARLLSAEAASQLIVRGWHPTAVIGNLAAAATCAKLFKLDENKIRMAFGISASEAGGLKANFGTDAKPFHAGKTASNGILAAILAQKGCTANDSILEGVLGLSKMFSGIESGSGQEANQPGQPYDISSPGGACIKPYPSCGLTHKAIDAMLSLSRKWDIKPENVADVECRTHTVAPNTLIHHSPKSGLEGKFSMEYCMAISLIDRQVGLKQFTDEKVASPESRKLMGKVRYSHPAGSDDPQQYLSFPQEVVLRLKGGEEYSQKVEFPKGHPLNPMSWEEVIAKFRDCAYGILTDAAIDRCIDLVTKLESVKDIRQLTNLVNKLT